MIVIGINHKNTPIEIREKIFLNPTQQDLLLSELKSDPSVIEACILSTCNRVEIYVHVLDAGMRVEPFMKLILKIKKVTYTQAWGENFYVYRGREAVRHLLEVAAGVDSLIIGEEQILGQVKGAFERARSFGMFSKTFNVLSNIAIRTGKKARAETAINVGGSSVSWAAIVKAQEVLGPLKECSILLIGAGKMSELAVGHIYSKQFRKLYLMNRTQDNVRGISEKYGGETVAFCDMKEILSQVDLCICSVSAPHYIIEEDIVRRVMPLRRDRRLVFIDISMPRNIDPAIGKIKNVHLYQIDDLREAVDSNLRLREAAIREVHKIIDAKIDEFYEKLEKFSGQKSAAISGCAKLPGNPA